MSDVLRSRRSTALATTDTDAAALEVRMKHANAIAAAQQALPSTYAKNPGAILLAQEWATARGVDLLTTIQSVSFISGRPVIDATMQRALAMRAGYEIDITVDDKSATCSLKRDGKPAGQSTYTLEDAKLAGLIGKDNWKKNPKAMLVARATAQTMRWHAPDVMVGVFTEDEIEDPVEVLEPTADVPAGEDVVDAEIVDVEEGGGTANDAGPPPVPVSDFTWHQVEKKVIPGSDDAKALKDWAHEQGITITRRALSEDQAQQVLAWEPDK